MRDIINQNRSLRNISIDNLCEKLLLLSVENIVFQLLKKKKKKKKDRDPKISAVTNIHTRFYIKIHEYPSTWILAAALLTTSSFIGKVKYYLFSQAVTRY